MLQLSKLYTDRSPQHFLICLTMVCGYTVRCTAKMSEQVKKYDQPSQQQLDFLFYKAKSKTLQGLQYS